jgi:hypothetical protein
MVAKNLRALFPLCPLSSKILTFNLLQPPKLPSFKNEAVIPAAMDS